MDSLLSGLSQHGYLILFVAVFLEAIGMPIPAAPALLIAGGASARGSLVPGLTVASGLSAMLLGDTLMFLMGRYTGWWLLGLLCRLSLNPESCILSSADSFHRRGRLLLVFAKFVPGINTMAPPLAGSMNMRYLQFARFDYTGAALYIGTYLSVGFLFSGALEAITDGYQRVAHLVGWVFISLVACYVGFQIQAWIRSRALRSVPFVSPAEAAQGVASDCALIYDVRSHGYYDPKAMRVKGSRRIDPNSLHQTEKDIPHDRPVYIYCTCVREATSARVAQELLAKGIRGGSGDQRRAG